LKSTHKNLRFPPTLHENRKIRFGRFLKSTHKNLFRFLKSLHKICATRRFPCSRFCSLDLFSSPPLAPSTHPASLALPLPLRFASLLLFRKNLGFKK
jgi:hypothetical protein